ncbi:MAG TPA: site-specific integrase, partial [Bryobacteraceae bacterium]
TNGLLSEKKSAVEHGTMLPRKVIGYNLFQANGKCVFSFVSHLRGSPQSKRFQESTGATSKTVAKEYEKRRKAELERAAAGLPTDQKAKRIRTVDDVVTAYLDGYKLNHRPKSVLFANGRLARVQAELGTLVLPDVTEDRIRGYIRKRQSQGIAGRTINMELGELSRAIGQPWSLLWPKVRKLEERKDVGRALSPAEQKGLLDFLRDSPSPNLRTLIPALLLTGMRAGEGFSLTWAQVDLMGKTLSVGRAKTSSGTGRVIPINDDLASILGAHRVWFEDRFGEPKPEHFLFAWGSPLPADPTRPITDVKHAWETLRKHEGVSCRLHDLRHTFATRLAEAGVSESTMLALMGHMSRSMLERYSHIRMAAKREAVAGITLRPKAENSEGVPVKVPVVEASATIQ